jgi:uncharacterized membrane protein
MNNISHNRSDSTPSAPRQSRPAPEGAPAAAPAANDARSVSVKVSVNGAPVPAPERVDRSERTETPAAPSKEETKAQTEPRDTRPSEEPREDIESDPEPHRPLTEALSPNVAGMLCYVFGWVSGLIFLLIDKRPFVRFHAAQSVVVFATLSLVLLVLSDFFLAAFLPGAGGLLLVLRRIVEIVWLVAAVALMLKAAAGEQYRAPYAGGYAEKAARARD